MHSGRFFIYFELKTFYYLIINFITFSCLTNERKKIFEKKKNIIAQLNDFYSHFYGLVFLIAYEWTLMSPTISIFKYFQVK